MGTAILVLAATIGAATATFALVDAVLIRPLPFTNQGQLMVLWAAEADTPLIEMSYPDFWDFRRETKAFQDVAANGSTPWNATMTGVGDPVVLPFGGVSGSFFDVLGSQPYLGRTLNAADEAPGATAVVVLSHSLWQQRFGSDPSAIGRVIALDNEPNVVVGVMPARFDYPIGSQLWAPLKRTIDGLGKDARDNLRAIGVLYMVGRLAPDVTTAQASDDAARIHRKLAAEYHLMLPDRRAVITPLVNQILGPARPALLLLGTAAGLVLLLACVNVAGLALVRALSRQSEVALRRALGASRLDIFRLLLSEAALLSASGLVLAVPVAILCLRFFVGLAPPTAAGLGDTAIGLRALSFACGAAAVAAAFAAIQPLLVLAWTGHVRLGPSAGRVTTGAGRGRQVIIATEVALTVTVLAAAGLAVRSFWNLRALDLGYTPEHVLLVETPGEDRPRIGEALGSLPGVRAVGAVSLRPLTLGPIGDDITFMLEGQSRQEVQRNPTLNRLFATPGYFRAMGIRLIAGRGFESRDLDSEAPVAIVSDVTARALWGTTDAVGRKIRIFQLSADERLTTIIGVVGSVRHRQLHEARLDYYMPTRDASTWAVRTAGNPAALATAARTLIREIDPGRPVETVTLQSLVSTAQRPWQFTALVLAAFSALALLLAATAVHGLVAYAVSLRTSEFGIRMALGATPAHIVRLVFQSIGSVSLIGLLAGIPGAMTAASAMRSLLFGVSSFDAVSLTVALGVLSVALIAACAVPSRRASRVDPAVALRAL
jgi:putative ABC transport system permease protein